MKTVVISYSQFGNTEQIAQEIVRALRAFGSVQLLHVDHPAQQPVELQGVDMLILGSPTQGWKPALPMQAFLDTLSSERIRGLTVACFDTRLRWPLWLSGSAAQRMARQIRTMGNKLLVVPESFFVEGKEGPLLAGEIERAARWALDIHQLYEASQSSLATH